MADLKQYIWIEGEGEGCDYTLGCNQTLIEIKFGSNPAEALKPYMGGQIGIKKALLFEGVKDLAPVLERLCKAEKKTANAKEILERELKIDKLKDEIEKLGG